MSASEDVTQLILRERQSRDRGWWDDMAGCYATDSIVKMSWFHGSGPDFVRRSREMAAGGGWGGDSTHSLSPPAVRVSGSRAIAELPLVIEFRITVDEVEADLASKCRSQYRAEQHGEAWLIAGVTSIYERDTLLPAVPGTRLDIDPGELEALRPSYRCLAWFLRRQGQAAPPDLLGDDQPEAVERQYEAEAAWLAAAPRSSDAS